MDTRQEINKSKSPTLMHGFRIALLLLLVFIGGAEIARAATTNWSYVWYDGGCAVELTPNQFDSSIMECLVLSQSALAYFNASTDKDAYSPGEAITVRGEVSLGNSVHQAVWSEVVSPFRAIAQMDGGTNPGQVSFNVPTTPGIYTISFRGCWKGQEHCAYSSVSVTVVPAPTVTSSFSPSSIYTGGTSNYSWSSTNAIACDITHSNGVGGWPGAPTSYSTGYQNWDAYAPYLPTTVDCYNSVGQHAYSSVTLTIIPAPVPWISASPTSVPYGGNSLLSWGQSGSAPTSCWSSGNWANSGTCATNGWLNGLTTSGTYTFYASNPAGTGTASVYITVAPPPAAAWSPTSVSYPYGGTVPAFGYSSTNASSCTIFDTADGSTLASGLPPSMSWPAGTFQSPFNTTSWGRKLICYGGSGAASSPSYFTATVGSPSSCNATTISNCSLPATSSGSSAGSCSSGYAGSCNYSCSNGTWNQSSNSCTLSPPTPWITASPTSVPYGGNSLLSWGQSGSAPTSCWSSGNWANSGTCAANGWLNGLTTSGTYTFYASNAGGTGSASAVVTVAPASATTASLSSSPNPVAYGGRSTLSWSSTNATSCTAGGPWSNASSPLGPGSGLTDPLTTNTTFTFQCTGPGGTSPLQSVTVNVNAPTCSNGANNPTACDQCPSGLAWVGGSCVACDNGGCSGAGGGAGNPLGSLVCNNGANNPWNCNAFPPTACALPWGGSTPSGSSVTAYQTSSVTSPTTCASVSQTRTCNNGTLSGSYTNQNCSVTTPPPPIVTISANPTRVRSGDTSTISWDVSNANCTVSGPGVNLSSITTPGSRSPTISSQSTYTINCVPDDGSSFTPRSVIVNVLPLFQEF